MLFILYNSFAYLCLEKLWDSLTVLRHSFVYVPEIFEGLFEKVLCLCVGFAVNGSQLHKTHNFKEASIINLFFMALKYTKQNLRLK